MTGQGGARTLPGMTAESDFPQDRGPRPHIQAATPLPAAGADLPFASPPYVGDAGGRYPLKDSPVSLTWEILYTAASALGAPACYTEWQDENGITWRDEVNGSTLTPAAPPSSEASRSTYDLVQVFQTRGAVSSKYVYRPPVPRGAATARLVLREAGDPSNPGTVQVRVASGWA